MPCPRCAAHNEESAEYCRSCGHRLMGDRAVPTRLVWSVLATFVCCPPVGAFAVHYSLEVTRRLEAGDVDGAWQASHRARLWALAAVGLNVATVLTMATLGLFSGVLE